MKRLEALIIALVLGVLAFATVGGTEYLANARAASRAAARVRMERQEQRAPAQRARMGQRQQDHEAEVARPVQ